MQEVSNISVKFLIVDMRLLLYTYQYTKLYIENVLASPFLARRAKEFSGKPETEKE